MSFLQKIAGGGRRDTGMTTGSIIGHLVRFAIPLFIGNVLQQLYNMVDTWVVGNYVSNEAFSAVGTVGPILNLLIGFFMGLSSGAGVVISQYYGAKQEDKVHDVVHTAMTVTLIMAVVITVAGLLLIPALLDLINTPPDVYPQSKTYITILFAGVSTVMIYNMSAGILRAVGDSVRPFLYLAAAAITNTILDLVFVLVFGMGVEGVAFATVIAQTFSAFLSSRDLLRTDTCVKLRIKDLHIDREMLKKVVRVGLPSGLQMSITSFSNVFVQSYINFFGSDVMASWTAYSKIDQLLFLPVSSLALSLTTFIGQNLGSSNVSRAKQGMKAAMKLAIGMTIMLFIPILIFAPSLIAFFNDKGTVVETGGQLLRVISPFYIFIATNNMYISALRGAGNSKVPMLVILLSYVAFRQVYLFIVSKFISNTLLPIAFGYPAGWFVCFLIMFIYYRLHPLSEATKVI